MGKLNVAVLVLLITGCSKSDVAADKGRGSGSGSGATTPEAMATIRAFAQSIGNAWLQTSRGVCPDPKGAVDPWGRPYRLNCDLSKRPPLLQVVSAGPDRTYMTDDDLVANLTVTDADPVDAAPPAIEVDARQLFADYEANEISADAKYRGKSLRVSGRIEQIGKDVFGKPFVALATTNQFSSVHAAFNSEGTLGSLRKGQALTVRCLGAGVTIGSPILKDCALEK